MVYAPAKYENFISHKDFVENVAVSQVRALFA